MGAAHLATLEKKAQNLKATLVFVDESGFSLLPTACRTWSPRGQTPILRHCFNWPKLSAISAVAANPHAYLHLVPGTVASDEVIRFVQHLLRQIPYKNLRPMQLELPPRQPDGGYRRPELWLSEGWAWVQAHSKRAPRTIQPSSSSNLPFTHLKCFSRNVSSE